MKFMFGLREPAAKTSRLGMETTWGMLVLRTTVGAVYTRFALGKLRLAVLPRRNCVVAFIL